MPIEKLTPAEIMAGKMDRVKAYARGIIGKTFGDNCEGGRPVMIKMTVFYSGFISLLEIVKSYSEPMTEVEMARIMQSLDFLIDVYNSGDKGWSLYNEGQKDVKPEDYLVTIYDQSKEQNVTVPVSEINEITFIAK